MDVVIELLMTVLSWLPASFLGAIILKYHDTMQPLYDMIGYINYFVPFYILSDMLVGWAVIMVTSLILTMFLRKIAG